MRLPLYSPDAYKKRTTGKEVLGMRNTKRFACAIMVLSLCILGACAMAETPSIGYAVRAVLPGNQLGESGMSFNLKVTPGQQQTLQVTVMNRGDEEIEVALEANTAYTNENGVIEFSYSEERDASLAVDFAQIATPAQAVIKVPANGEATAEFLVRVPEEPFEGAVYGGFLFTKLGQGEDAEDAGMAIRNIYRYAIGVRLQQSEVRIEPAFDLTGAEMSPSGPLALLLDLHNPQAVVARGITLCARVYPKGSEEPIITFDRENVAMAPNSSMRYTLYFHDNTPLESGEYSVLTELEFDGQTWLFETPLTVN